MPGDNGSGSVSGATPQHVMLASSRAVVHAFFSHLENTRPWLSVLRIPLDATSLDSFRDLVVQADTALVDVAADPGAAIRLCALLHSLRSGLPLVGLLCCPRSIAPGHLKELVASGVHSMLDLQASPDETARVLRSVARGQAVLHVRFDQLLGALHPDLLEPGVNGNGKAGLFHGLDASLLELVADGLSDRAIGERLYLSRHTIHHRLERLRETLGLRNRTELAAWAGFHGFYHPGRQAAALHAMSDASSTY